MREYVIEKQTNHVRRLVLNRPTKLNAVNMEMEAELDDALDDAMADENTSVVILSGAGRAFSAGIDIKSGSMTEVDHSDSIFDLIRQKARMDNWMKIWSAPKPLIAQVHGYCLGSANELVGCCDLVVCGESTQMGMPEVSTIALPPTLAFWPFRMGLQRTKEMLFTGRLMNGEEAVRLGLACAVVADDELESYVDALASTIAETPLRRLVVAKRAANSWFETMGIRAAAYHSAEYHPLYHLVSEWHTVVEAAKNE